jgi:hypothetical protein
MLRGCWSCGAHGPCDDDCECAKCLDPDGYDDWRDTHPDQYAAWLARQELDDDDECDCPSCLFDL